MNNGKVLLKSTVLGAENSELFFLRVLNRCGRQKEEIKAEKPPMYETILPVLNKDKRIFVQPLPETLSFLEFGLKSFPSD